MNTNFLNQEYNENSDNSDYEGIEDEENEEGKLKFNEEEELLDEDADDEEVVTDSDLEGKGGNQKSEDLNENEDLNQSGDLDIEMEDYTESEVDKVNELLFCVQGIGRYKDQDKTIYEKGNFCEPSMRDIHRFLRKDDPENPKCRFCMLTWKIAENDIIPVILNYENNEKIQQLGLVILVDLTEPLAELIDNRTQLESMLTDLQEYIVNSNLIELLARSLADSTAKLREATMMKNNLKLIEQENNIDNNDIIMNDNMNSIDELKKKNEIKKKIAEVESKSQTLIELIFVLIKQILNISDSNGIKRNVNNTLTLMKKFANLKIFDAIVFHSQNYDSDFNRRMSSTILELVFYLIRPFTVTQIYQLANHSGNNLNKNLNNNNISIQNANNSEMTMIQRLKEEERQQKMTRQSMYSSRSNKFNTMIQVNRPLNNSSFIISNVNQLMNNGEKMISEKINEFSHQRKKPRKNIKVKSKHQTTSKAYEEILLVNDLQITENFTNLLDFTYKDLLQIFKSFCEDFLINCFNPIIKYFFHEIQINEKIEKYDIYHIICIINFFLEINRFREHSIINEMKSKNNLNYKIYEFNINFVTESINQQMMEFIYNLAYSESLKTSRKELKLFESFSSLKYIKQVILTSLDLYKYKSEANTQCNVLIQDCLITKDFSKIVKSNFNFYNENYHPKKMLFDCIEFCEVYFTCLDLYSEKRKLIRRIKKKKIKRKEEEDEDEEKILNEMDQFIEKEKDDSKSENSDNSGQVSFHSDNNITIDDEEKTLEIDAKNEMKILLDYSIISRILSLFNVHNDFQSGNLQSILQNYKKDTNNSNIIKIISKLFDRITKVIKEIWIFYQMEYLYIFNILMTEQIFLNDIFFNSLKNSVKFIINSFFESTRKNKLLVIESLFRFPSPIIKDEILNNYEYVERIEEKENNIDREYIPDENDYEGESKSKYLECEYDGTNVQLVKLEKEKKNVNKNVNKNKKVELNKIEEEDTIIPSWTENEDLLLIKNYFEFKEHPEVFSILESLFTLKSKKEIMKRVKSLKMRKGEDKAMKMFRKIHKKRKDKDEKMFNIIIELSDQCRDEEQKNKIEKTIDFIKQQLESFKLRKGLLDNNSECVLIPTNQDEIEIMKDKNFKNFIKNLGLIPPEEDEEIIIDLNYDEINLEEVKYNYNNKNNFWKLDSKKDQTEISIIIEKLTNFERIISENLEIEIPEFEAEKEKAKKEKKLKKRNKKEKKEKKKKHKKEKKEKRKNSNSDADDEDNEYLRNINDYNGDNKSNFTTTKSIQKSKISYKTNNNYNNNKSEFSYSVKDDTKSITHIDIDQESGDISKKKKRLKKGLKNDDDFNFD